LNKITYADGTYTAFTNSTANWLYSARFYSDASTYNRVNLEFTDGKVTKATALYASPSSTTIYKSVLTFIYGDTTKVTYSDSATAQDNDYYETIYFDTAGRTTGIIDSEGYFSYGQYASGDLAPFDVIERHTTGKVAVENLISDGLMLSISSLSLIYLFSDELLMPAILLLSLCGRLYFIFSSPSALPSSGK
jgi:hypothetical protein